MPTPNSWGLTYRDVIGLCWLAYNGQGSKGLWRIGAGTWNLTKVHQKGSFRAVTVISPTKKKILSFAGTDDLADWGDNVAQGLLGFSVQYIRSRVVASRVRPDIVVGHSLGGGLASYVAIHQGTNAATINPAPLNLTGFLGGNIGGRIFRHGRVKNYVVPGEALDILDIAALSMARVGEIHNVSSGGSNPIQKHLIRNLTGFTAPTRI